MEWPTKARRGSSMGGGWMHPRQYDHHHIHDEDDNHHCHRRRHHHRRRRHHHHHHHQHHHHHHQPFLIAQLPLLRTPAIRTRMAQQSSRLLLIRLLLLLLASRRRGRGTIPCKYYVFPMHSSLRRGLPGRVGEARHLVNIMVFRYPPRSGGASLEAWEGRETL